jgi:hypothetical protein
MGGFTLLSRYEGPYLLGIQLKVNLVCTDRRPCIGHRWIRQSSVLERINARATQSSVLPVAGSALEVNHHS